MRVVILECVMNCNCSDAHVRQAKILCEYLRNEGHSCTILYIDDMRNFINEKYDVVIKSYSTFYENYACEIKLCVNNKDNAKFFFITNEYTIQASNVLNKTSKAGVKWNVIANFDTKTITNKLWQKKYFLNLNSLFYQPKELQTKKYNICYYGTYRKDRKAYFQKYFINKDFILSTSPKSVKKFIKDNCIFKACKRFTWGKHKDTLGLFKYSLYIEDKWIHSNFHNLADRFYEAMSNATVTLWDKSCVNTLAKSELAKLDYKSFIVDSYNDIINRNYEEDWKIQQKWSVLLEQQKQKTLEQFRDIICDAKRKE